MYQISWETCSTQNNNGIIVDIDDIRLILKRKSSGYILAMGIRVYSKDANNSMIRPPVNVLTIPACELDEAKIITQNYLNNFLSSILSNLS